MYNQQFPPPQPPPFQSPSFPPPPSPPDDGGGGNSTKYILGALGAVGCLGVILAALGVGGYYYYNRSRNANNDNIVFTNGNDNYNGNGNRNGNLANANNRNANTSNANNSNGNTGGGVMRSRIQQRVGPFRMEGVNPVGEAPAYNNYPLVNQASQILTNIIRGSNATETWLARYTDSRSTLDFWRVDHRIAVCDSPATANSLMQQAVTQLQGAGYRVARRDQTRLTDNSIAGSKVFMETGQTDTDVEVALWTNGQLFCSAATGKRGNASQFEQNTTY